MSGPTLDRARTGRVDVPEGALDGVEVRRITVEKGGLANILAGARATLPGEYTALYVDGALWMSDTDAEYRDHGEAIYRIRRPEARTVLVNGLGLGMVVQAALDCDHIESVDVVEHDQRVIDLVGPHYTRDSRVRIHHADAYTIAWPVGARWDVVWHDIWLNLCTDNLDDMARLHRRYGRRAAWQGSWGKELLRLQRDRERRSGWW